MATHAGTNNSLYTTFTGAEAIARFGLDTGAFERRIAGGFIAHSIEAVERILQQANEQGFKIWPISGGMNFGYGTAMPVNEDNYILDLSQLKQIIFNPKSHSVTIEPGVNQQDLADFLDQRGLEYLVPTTGLGPNGSLLGNALDGGYGLTPVCDHFEALSEIEGVFGNGVVFRHNYRDIGCETMAQNWHLGTGPNFNSLLRQGNYAVITRATIRLARKPEATRVVVIEWSSDQAFVDGQEALSLIMEDIPGTGGIISMNAHRVLSAQHDTPLRNSLNGDERVAYLDKIAKSKMIAPWTSVGTLYGSKYVLKGAVRDIRRRCKGARVWAFSVGQIKSIAGLMKLVPKSMFKPFHNHTGMLEEMVGTVEGRPLVAFLQMAYALDDKGLEMTRERNPAKDGQGILWYGPLVTIDSEAVTDYMEQMQKVLYKYGFDNLLAVTTRSSRAHCGTIPLIFRKDDETAVARAKACYRELVRVGVEYGMPPYRIGAEYMNEIYPAQANGFTHTMHGIKQHLDPNEVIAPGRYMPMMHFDQTDVKQVISA